MHGMNSGMLPGPHAAPVQRKQADSPTASGLPADGGGKAMLDLYQEPSAQNAAGMTADSAGATATDVQSFAENAADTTSDTIDQLLKDIDTKIQELQAWPQDPDVSKVLSDEDRTRMANMVKELERAKTELGDIKTSGIKLHLHELSADDDSGPRTEMSDDGIHVYYSGIASKKNETMLHELKHVYQYMEGKVDYIKTREGEYIPGALYDIFDEVNAYRRQVAMGGIRGEGFPTVGGSEMTLNYDNVTPENLVKMTKQGVGQGYDKIPQTPLDGSTRMKKVLSAHAPYQDDNLVSKGITSTYSPESLKEQGLDKKDAKQAAAARYAEIAKIDPNIHMHDAAKK